MTEVLIAAPGALSPRIKATFKGWEKVGSQWLCRVRFADGSQALLQREQLVFPGSRRLATKGRRG